MNGIMIRSTKIFNFREIYFVFYNKFEKSVVVIGDMWIFITNKFQFMQLKIFFTDNS